MRNPQAVQLRPRKQNAPVKIRDKENREKKVKIKNERQQMQVHERINKRMSESSDNY